MDWIRDNKFLAGYTAVFVIVGALLAYLLVSARSAYQSTMVNYDNTLKSVELLSGKPLYPDKESLSMVQEEAKKFKKAVNALHAQMLAYNRPLDATMTGGGFQKKLTERVVALKKRSVLEKIKIDDGFSLGLEKYTSELPSEKAVRELDFHLDALDFLANALFDAEIDSIETFERLPLVIEDEGKGESEEKDSGANGESSNRSTPAATEYIKRYPVRICFKGRPETLENFVNRISNAPKEEFFFNTSYMTIRNETDEGPEKGIEFEAGLRQDEGIPDENEDAAAVTDTAENAEGVVDSRVVLGNEKIEACLVVEAIRIEPVPTDTADAE